MTNFPLLRLSLARLLTLLAIRVVVMDEYGETFGAIRDLTSAEEKLRKRAKRQRRLYGSEQR